MVIVISLVLILLPVLYGFLLRDQGVLKQQSFTQSMGTLTDGIRHYKKMQAYYYIFFIIRRFIFVLFILTLKHLPSLVINLVIMLNVLAVSYTGTVEPHDDRLAHGLELYNEACFQLFCYGIVATMLSPGITFDITLGWMMILLIYYLLLVNTIVVGREKFKLLKWKLHICKLKSNSKNISKVRLDSTKMKKTSLPVEKSASNARVFEELA